MNKKILVVDDEVALAEALKLKLTSEGYEVTIANNGEDALNQLLTGQFHVALLDLLMPKLNGFEVLQNVKDKNINTSILVTSNLSQQEDMQRATGLGAKFFLVKSNNSLEQIVEKIKEIASN